MAKYNSFDSFIKAHKGKAMDYDGVAGAQCVDLAKYYLKEVFNINPGAWGNAHAYYDNFEAHPELVKNFKKIANTPNFIPKKGDIAVWKPSLSSGGWGHIAICDGKGDTSYFYSYDQNWTGRHDPCTRIKHNYNHFYGVLRPKDQNKVTPKKKPAPKVLDKTGFKMGNNSIGVLAVKQMLILAGYKMDKSGLFGPGTKGVVNTVLKKWGYAQNGIAGANFIRKLRESIK